MVCNTLLIPCWAFGLHYLVMFTAAVRAALPNPTTVDSIIVCPNNGVAASV